MKKNILKIILLLSAIVYACIFIFLFNPITGGLGAYGVISELRRTPDFYTLLNADKTDSLSGVDMNLDGIRDDVYNFSMKNIKNNKVQKDLMITYLQYYERIFYVDKYFVSQLKRQIEIYRNLDFCIGDHIDFDDYDFRKKMFYLYFNTEKRRGYYRNIVVKHDDIYPQKDYSTYDFISFYERCTYFQNIDLFPFQFKLYRKHFKNDISKAKRLTLYSYSELIDMRISAQELESIKVFYKELDARYKEGQFSDMKGW
ncbi:hypothetical protein ACRXCV_09550 [Halobacteriovorax sp. GFR7]|uniref:hypothetical protein n=1 Tax=unclassified Halobacteriovorax TaxID=2639665 RepID=UPI003D98C062